MRVASSPAYIHSYLWSRALLVDCALSQYCVVLCGAGCGIPEATTVPGESGENVPLVGFLTLPRFCAAVCLLLSLPLSLCVSLYLSLYLSIYMYMNIYYIFVYTYKSYNIVLSPRFPFHSASFACVLIIDGAACLLAFCAFSVLCLTAQRAAHSAH